jgi:exopolysaccharide production protein ExoQ
MQPPSLLVALLERSVPVFVVMAIALTMSAFYLLFGAPPQMGTAEVTGSASAASNPLYIGLRVLLWGWAGAIVLYVTFRDGLAVQLLLGLPLVVLVFASAFWSVSFGWTFYFATMFAANVIVAYALAVIVSPERFLRILSLTLGALVLASFAMLVLFPDYAMTSRWEGGWIGGIQFNGVFAHKSTAGVYFGTFLIILWLANVMTGLLRLAATALTVLALLLSNSATGTLGAVVIIGLFTALRLTRLPVRASMVTVGAATLLFASIVPFVSFGEATELIGRDSGLTGRTWIWAAATEFIAERPLLGYGYNGFFYPGDFSPAWKLWDLDPYFHTPHFHNSTIDVAVSLGLVGVAVYAAVVLASYRIAANTSIALPARRALAAILTMMVLTTASDMTIMAHNTFATTMLFYCFFAGRMHYRGTH